MNEQVLLKALLKQRHWQTYRTFCTQYDRAARAIDPTLVGSYPSRAQLHRWQSGDLKGLPYPHHCQILEAMFPGFTAAQLFDRTDLALVSNTGAAIERTPKSLLASVPPSFSAEVLGGPWVTCYQFDSDRGGIRHHADITQLIPQSSRRITATNYPPDPRTQGHIPGYHNEIEAQLVNRHLIGHWKNINDTRYFGSIHLATLPGETVMEGYYTSLSSDIKVDTMRWKWVRLEPGALSDVELPQVVLKDPDLIYALLEQPTYDVPLALAAIVERSN